MPKRVRSHEQFIKRELLLDPEFAAEYVNSALQDDDPDTFLGALRRVAEARRMSLVAEGAGVERESLYRMLKSGGNPSYRNLWFVLKAVGLRIGASSEVLDPSRRGGGSAFTAPSIVEVAGIAVRPESATRKGPASAWEIAAGYRESSLSGSLPASPRDLAIGF